MLRLSSPAGVKLTDCSIYVPRCGGGNGTGKHMLSQQLLVFYMAQKPHTSFLLPFHGSKLATWPQLAAREVGTHVLRRKLLLA